MYLLGFVIEVLSNRFRDAQAFLQLGKGQNVAILTGVRHDTICGSPTSFAMARGRAYERMSSAQPVHEMGVKQDEEG